MLFLSNQPYFEVPFLTGLTNKYKKITDTTNAITVNTLKVPKLIHEPNWKITNATI